MIPGLIVVLVLGYVISRVAIGYPAPQRRYRKLGRGEVAFITSAAEAMFPAGGAIPSSGLEADLPSYLERFLIAARPKTRLLVHLLIFLVEHATLLFPAPGRGGMRRYSSLDTQQRVAALDGWEQSAFFARRVVFTSLRALWTMGYFANPSVVRKLGMAPLAIDTPICEADLLYPRIGEHPDSIQLTESDLTPPSEAEPLEIHGPLHAAYTEFDL
jgi:hypothetical protein